MKTADWNHFIAAYEAWLSTSGRRIIVLPGTDVELDGTSYPLGTMCQEVLAASRAGLLTTRQTGTLTQLGQTNQFLTFLEHLDAWVAEHGTAHVPQNTVITTTDGATYKLGRQANQMRERYASANLSVPQIVALEQRPGWVWGIWYERADRVADYLEQHGSLEGLHEYDRTLYAWLQRQMRADLKPDQSRRLIELIGERDPRSDIEIFVDNVLTWLKQDPDRTLADLKVNDVWTTPEGSDVRLGKQAAYYRSRRNTGKLAPQDSELIDARLPGFWDRS